MEMARLVTDVDVSLAEVRPLFEHKPLAKGLDPASFRDRFEDRVARYGSDGRRAPKPLAPRRAPALAGLFSYRGDRI